MKRGQSFFSIPQDHKAHNRVAAMLRIFTRTRPVSVWEMTCAAIGEDRARELGRDKAVHLCERCVRAAEENDFIRRLPIRLKPGVGEPVNKKGFSRALAFTITDDGEAFLKRHDEYIRYKRMGYLGHEENDWFHLRRVRRHVSRVQEKYERRMKSIAAEAPGPAMASSRAKGKKKR